MIVEKIKLGSVNYELIHVYVVKTIVTIGVKVEEQKKKDINKK